jgi:two-component system response regulator DegU
MIRVAIIDDDSRSRKELEKLLQKDPNILVVAETGLAGIKEIEEQKPDVIVLDNKKPFTDCLEATETIVGKFEDTKIIVLSMDSKNTLLPLHAKHTLEGSLCQVGACFHLCQNCSPEDILAAIRDGHQPG